MSSGTLREAVSPLWLTNDAFTGKLPHVAGVLSSERSPPSSPSVNDVAKNGGRLSNTVSMPPSPRSDEMPMIFCGPSAGLLIVTIRRKLPGELAGPPK